MKQAVSAMLRPMSHRSLLAGSSAETIVLLAVGGILLILSGVNEIFTNRSPIIPPRLFRVRDISCYLCPADPCFNRRALPLSS